MFLLERVRGDKDALAPISRLQKPTVFVIFLKLETQVSRPLPRSDSFYINSKIKTPASWDPYFGAGEGSRTPVSSLENSHNNRYTTPAHNQFKI